MEENIDFREYASAILGIDYDTLNKKCKEDPITNALINALTNVMKRNQRLNLRINDIEYYREEGRKESKYLYEKFLPEIFENLYHQEDEGDFTPMQAFMKLNEDISTYNTPYTNKK